MIYFSIAHKKFADVRNLIPQTEVLSMINSTNGKDLNFTLLKFRDKKILQVAETCEEILTQIEKCNKAELRYVSLTPLYEDDKTEYDDLARVFLG